MSVVSTASSAIALTSSAIALTKKLIEIQAISKSAEAKLLIAELQLQLAEIKSKMADVMLENLQLKEELRKATSVPEGGLYYKKDDDGPFCTNCFDSNAKLIRVVEQPQFMQHGGRYACPTCATLFCPC